MLKYYLKILNKNYASLEELTGTKQLNVAWTLGWNPRVKRCYVKN